MTLDDLVSEMRDQAEKLRELNHTVLFDLGDDGKILLDATGGEVLVTPDPADDNAETTLTLSADNMVKLINGDLNPMAAFTMRKLKVFGSKRGSRSSSQAFWTTSARSRTPQFVTHSSLLHQKRGSRPWNHRTGREDFDSL